MAQIKKLITGSEIVYSCICITSMEYEYAIQDIDTSVHGFVVDGVFKPAEDVTLNCKKDWCLPILEGYTQKYWIVIKKHPGELYMPMSDITQQANYTACTYDIWQSEVGLVAVVTEADV